MPSVATAFESLSVVIPAYNAAAHLAATLADVRGWLDASGVAAEIIVVDDGSSDGTAERVRHAAPDARLLRNTVNRGKGHAVRRGMLAATRAWTLFMDADNSTRIEHLERFASHAGDADVVIASRRLAASRIVRRQPPLRQLLGRAFPYVVRLLAIPDIRDTQCGFKLFRRDAARAVFSRARVERFAFDVEILLLARRLGLRIVEVPIDWDNPTDSTLRVSTDAARMLADLLATAYRLRLRRRLPAPIEVQADDDDG